MHLVTYLHPRLPTDSAEEPESDSAEHRYVNATARRDGLFRCAVEETMHKPLHVFEVMIHGDQFCCAQATS